MKRIIFLVLLLIVSFQLNSCGSIESTFTLEYTNEFSIESNLVRECELIIPAASSSYVNYTESVEHSCKPIVAFDISDIPYFGDRSKFHITTEQALAYAEAIKTAYLDPLASWGYFAFDMPYVVLLDISGDGSPLLLLAERDSFISWGDAYWNMLFGFADGDLQRITDYPTGIGIATIGNERMLALINWSDFGGTICLYRVQGGAANLVSSTRFFDDWHNGAFYVNGINVTESEFLSAIDELAIEHLMETSHAGTVHVLPIFEAYLSRTFIREKVAQVFLDYASTRDI